MSDHNVSDYVLRNRSFWDGQDRVDLFTRIGESGWKSSEPSWGIFSVPEADLHMFPDNLAGMDAVDLGCGTGYVSAWMKRLGANPVGIDNSPRQLETTARLQREHGLDFPLHLGNAEETPFEDESFDFAISEYGASIWCDPYKWIPEAARILRPGGLLHFLVNGTVLMLCSGPELPEDQPVGEHLSRPLFGMHRIEWDDSDEVEFHLSPGKMIALLRESGFDILELIEVEVPDNATSAFPMVTKEWAQKWPCEEIWKVRKRQ